MRALHNQLLFELERFKVKKGEIETLFIGGGTPSCVEASLYAPLFNTLRPYLQKDAECTSEANPNSATKSWLEAISSMGINRISFGVQSFDSAKLKALGRAHSSADALKALNEAHKIGIKNLSLDLIYGVQGDSSALLKEDISIAFDLGINHLSAYALTIEEGTPFQKAPHMSQERLALTQMLFEEITSKGFTQYEISNFGTYQSQHNLGYWHHKEYIGLGAGAVGYFKQNRLYPQSDIQSYIQNPRAHKSEQLSPDEIVTEKLFLGFRSVVGVDATILSNEQKERADILVNEGKLTCNSGRYFNTEYLLSDEIALFVEG